MSFYRLSDKLEGTASLLGTRCDRGPHPLTPLSSEQTARALRETPVDDTEAQSPLSDIIGGLNIWVGDEGEVLSAMGAKALSKSCRLSPSACSSSHGEKRIAFLLDLSLEVFRFKLVSTMD